jgi:putative membrane protein
VPESPPSESTLLARERTLLAHERTLMAWVRTAASLISFGFTIYKFFDYLVQSNRAVDDGRWFGPRAFAMAMMGVGLVALVLAIIGEAVSSFARRARRSGARSRRPWRC